MNRNITLGVVVALTVAVVALFFIFNPFTSTPASSLSFGASPSPSNSLASTTGLVVQDQTVGTGATAQPGDLVTVNYTGKLQNGTVFDTTAGKQPFEFVLGQGQVIPGWDAGIQGMKVGGTRILIIPPSLGYGSGAAGPIAANATLTFEVTLLKVRPAASSGQYAPEGAAAQ